MSNTNPLKARHAIDVLRASTHHLGGATKVTTNLTEFLKALHEMDKALDKEDTIQKPASKSALKRKSQP